MARGFTEQEQANIRMRLLEACKQGWTQYGYKKTSVEELCIQAGISKGAFYLFFASKEELFGEVLCSVQGQIFHTASKIMEGEKNKRGVAKALKYIYREYDKNNFLYRSDSMDYTILRNKLPKEQAQKMEESMEQGRRLFLGQPYLTLKVPPDMALSVIYSLILNIKHKDGLVHDHIETFDFMADHLIGCLYE